ncbi:MAG: M15 family metallopeptidase [Bacteroidota bacterium]
MKRILWAMLLTMGWGTAVPVMAQDGEDIPEGMVRLRDVAPTIQEEIRYTTDFNFLGRPVAAYDAPVCWLSRPAAEALARVQADLAADSLSLKVFDCYRPQSAVDDFVQWSYQPRDTLTKRFFYPDLIKRRLFALGYIASRSGHSRGSTVDLTLVPLGDTTSIFVTTPPGLRCDQPDINQRVPEGLDMGTTYDCFSERSHTANPGITELQRDNRQKLKAAMAKHGFRNYSKEWWHYTLRNEPFRQQYFDFRVTEGDGR